MLACVLAASLVLPGTAFAADAAGGIQLGIRVTDSSQSQGQSDPVTGQPGSTVLGIRVTDSSSAAPLNVQVTFDPCNGSAPIVQESPYNAPVTKLSDPVWKGYAFLGWFTAASGGSAYDFDIAETGDVTLYAQWALVVSCTIPTAAAVSIDASGTVTGEDQPFVSQTVVPLKVSAVKSEMLPDASSVLADQATLDGARVVLTPPADAGSVVRVPLSTSQSGQPADFAIPAEGALSVSFGLALPAGAKLSYLESAVDVARLSYVIGLAAS